MTEYQDWLKIKYEKEEAVDRIEAELAYIKEGIVKDLKELYEERRKISSNIYNEKEKILLLYNRLKKTIDDFLEQNKELLNDYSINIRAGIVIEDNLQNEIFEFINKQKKNAFREDNYQLYRTIEELNNIHSIEEYIEIPELIVRYIKDFSIDIASQIKTNYFSNS